MSVGSIVCNYKETVLNGDDPFPTFNCFVATILWYKYLLNTETHGWLYSWKSILKLHKC